MEGGQVSTVEGGGGNGRPGGRPDEYRGGTGGLKGGQVSTGGGGVEKGGQEGGQVSTRGGGGRKWDYNIYRFIIGIAYVGYFPLKA